LRITQLGLILQESSKNFKVFNDIRNTGFARLLLPSKTKYEIYNSRLKGGESDD
jgi:hypothetical protein